MADVTGMRAIQQIKDIATCKYQATGLEDGTKYYIAVTAVDKSGNEGVRVANVSAMPAPMQRGTVDPDIAVDVYQPDLVWAGTTLLPDNHNSQKPRIIEVNMLGEIVWQYVLPDNFKHYTNPGFDVELLTSNNILFVLPGKGVYEIDRSGSTVWSYLTPKISHDADRLPNGNTLFAFGFNDQKADAQVKEVNPKGEIVWQWYAKDYFDKPPYDSIYNEGWTHTNAVSRLTNGDTLISLRNFNLVVEVDPKGEVVRTIGEGVLDDQHDPEILPNGNLLAANHNQLPQHQGKPQMALEIDPKTGEIVWQFPVPEQLLRDANRLPNGNTLITGSTKIVEVTADGKIVWQLTLKGITLTGLDAAGLGFYKAERISAQK
jgi:outer membrane protein assembly factor BamB